MNEGHTYADGTSGWSGSEASEKRIRALDANGTTRTRQRQTLDLLHKRRHVGMTQGELQDELGIGHGTASQVLSTLHQAGKVERLTMKFAGSHIYVLPEHVQDRPTSPYRRLQSRTVLRERIGDLERALRDTLNAPNNPAVRDAALSVLNDDTWSKS